MTSALVWTAHHVQGVFRSVAVPNRDGHIGLQRAVKQELERQVCNVLYSKSSKNACFHRTCTARALASVVRDDIKPKVPWQKLSRVLPCLQRRLEG